MKHNIIGNTGIHIPPIVFGTSALGNLYSEPDYATKLEIVKECIAHVPKPVVFDCAGKYGAGLALEMLGKIFEELNIASDDVIISNKLAWYRVPLTTDEPTFEPGIWKNLKNDAIQKINHRGIIECWEQGNKLLGEKYSPKMVSVHDPDEYLNQAKTTKERERLLSDIVEAYCALLDLKTQGKVKAVGIGAKDWKVIREITRLVNLDWVMFANSLTIMNHPAELLDFFAEIHAKKIAIINSAVFHAGFLTGGDFYDYKLMMPDTPENKARFEWRDSFFACCMNHYVIPATACINFSMTPPGVVSIALNTSKPENIKKNVDSVNSSIQADFWAEMKLKGLINADYPYV